MKMNKLWIIVIIIMLLLGVFCLIADAANLLPLPNFPISVIGACLGAIVTSIITVFLLKAQTLEKAKAEIQKERFAVLFTKKAETYDHYIEKLYTVIKDNKADKKGLDELEDDLNFKLQMYLEERSLKNIIACLEKMGESKGNELKSQGVKIVEILKYDLNQESK